jgi:hypothetical protein
MALIWLAIGAESGWNISRRGQTKVNCRLIVAGITFSEAVTWT